ncbi:hypothetical protein A3709_20815 [Halioglobus sp. HI00S01]|uniref:hypothetical protein n=1 Tax=Halioglobus sp. HI00S01 TaxID=1822214 RepID=UPI0007C3DE6B|nr:hypothetical protein [Halioglobus sp. HI00S01]KZX58057.1 hypothetical protein A3709_20815 [Halioglobus sp. HI00S01]
MELVAQGKDRVEAVGFKTVEKAIEAVLEPLLHEAGRGENEDVISWDEQEAVIAASGVRGA